MSGGHFEYKQWNIHQAAEDIERLIATNDDKTLDEWGSTKGYGYPPEIIAKFAEAAHTLHQAAEMMQRVDWLVSGDDGPECFLRRWEKEVRPYWQNVDVEAPPPLKSDCAETEKLMGGCPLTPCSFSSFSAEVEVDEEGSYYVHPVSGKRVNQPVGGWRQDTVSFHPLKPSSNQPPADPDQYP